MAHVLFLGTGWPAAAGGSGAGPRLKVGDAVFGLAHGCLGSHVVGPANLLAPLPPHVSFAEAATLPTVSANDLLRR